MIDFLHRMGSRRRHQRHEVRPDAVLNTSRVEEPSQSAVMDLALAEQFSNQWWTQFGEFQWRYPRRQDGCESEKLAGLATSLAETARNIDVQLFKIELANLPLRP